MQFRDTGKMLVCYEDCPAILDFTNKMQEKNIKIFWERTLIPIRCFKRTLKLQSQNLFTFA